MIRIEQQRDLGHQIMTVRNEDEDRQAYSDFREQMLLYNRIDGVMPFEIRTESGEKVYEYDIENLESLSEYCTRKKPGKTACDRLLKGILSTVLRGSEFMLAEDDYIVGPDTVYIDRNENIYMAYYPGYGENLRLQLREIAEFLMNEVDYTDEAAVLSVYGFYMRTKDATTTFEDLLGTLTGSQNSAPADEEKSRGKVSPRGDVLTHGEVLPRGESREQTGIKQPVRIKEPIALKEYDRGGSGPDMVEIIPHKQPVSLPEGKDHRQSVKAQEEEKLSLTVIFSESPLKLKLISLAIPVAALIIFTLLKESGILSGQAGRLSTVRVFAAFVVLAVVCFEAEKRMWKKFIGDISEKFRSAKEKADEQTVLLYDGESAGYPFSLVSDSNPPINVSHFPFFVGKDETRCDYVLASQVGISRFHMKIDREGEEFTISDLNSTNGTFVNGERLAPHYPKKVRRGDELRIGKCIYYCN